MTAVRHILLLCVMWILPAVCHGGEDGAWEDRDRQSLRFVLNALKMTEHDLSFSKANAVSSHIAPVALAVLQEPLRLPGFSDSVMNRLRVATHLVEVGGWIGTNAPNCVLPSTDHRQGYGTESSPLRGAVMTILDAVAQLQAALPKPRREAYEAFALGVFRAPQDRALLDSDLVRREEALELQDDELARRILAGEARNEALAIAYARLLRAVDGLVARKDFANVTDATWEFPEGNVIIGGPGPNVYTNEALLIVDVGGDDVYENSAGGADGMAGRPVSIVIDLAGNDRYIARHPISQGAGVFGVGILVDVAGDDVYEATHFSQGAGFYGHGLLADYGGKDTFQAGGFAQGAGAFGTGTLWQRGGDTRYQAIEMAQGFAATEGQGLLVDTSGNDSYFAGGDHACDWLPGHHFSLAQGFGYGMRPFAGGGVGVLADLAGDDCYEADVYGQGASYWYSVGLLLEGGGNDSYRLYQYGQGAGIHLSSGALVDWGGDDRYVSHGISQGGAHDYAVGMLLDHAGNDSYNADSTAQGGAINTSFALLLDRAGNDCYTGTDSNLTQAAGNYGGRRECGSIGLLLDLGGRDQYSQGQTNQSLWLKTTYGAGLDGEGVVDEVTPLPSPTCILPSPSEAPPCRGVDVHHPWERLLRRACREPNTEEHRKDAAQAWSELQRLGTEALPYLLSRLDCPDVMVRVRTEELVDYLGTNAIPALLAGLQQSNNEDVTRHCCYLLARFESIPHAVPVIVPLLSRENVRATALYTLGHLRAREAYQPALASLHDHREMVRLRAAQALGRLRNRRAIPFLVAALDDEFWTVRYAAEDALVAMGASAVSPLRIAHRRASPLARRYLVDALFRLGDPGARALALGKDGRGGRI